MSRFWNIIAGLAVRLANRCPKRVGLCFSVVIPIYDRTEELREAIESVLRQSFQNFELLLICDGSPRKTLDVVESYLSHPKVRAYFFQDNSGTPCRGRNKGIEMSRGRYVAFLDSDDRAESYRLERTLFHFIARNVDVVGGAIRYMTGGDACRGFYDGQIGFTTEYFDYNQLVEGNRLSICTVAVKRKLLIQYGGFREEMRYREDHELWLRLAYCGSRFYNSPEVFADYRIHEGNAELLYFENDSHWKNMALKNHTKDFI